MSEHELNAYRRDVTNRFWAGVYRRRILDKMCGALLAIAGFGSLALLFWAAVAPSRIAEPTIFIPIAATVLIIPLGVMFRIMIESRILDSMMRSPNRVNAEKKSRKIKPRSKPQRGEIHIVTSHIRRLLRNANSQN